MLFSTVLLCVMSFVEDYRPYDKDKHTQCWWLIQLLILAGRTERVGYPTQKMLSPYELIISASSNEAEMMLDLICGCAINPISAEGFGRQSSGIDIRDKAHEIIIGRPRDEGLVAPDTDEDCLFALGNITCLSVLSSRADERDTVVPLLQVVERYAEPRTRR